MLSWWFCEGFPPEIMPEWNLIKCRLVRWYLISTVKITIRAVITHSPRLMVEFKISFAVDQWLPAYKDNAGTAWLLLAQPNVTPADAASSGV